jgi:WD40 repeat protein
MKMLGLKRWRSLPLFIVLMMIMGEATLFAQTDPVQPEDQKPVIKRDQADELPEHAIWRIEEPENARNANGIYRLQYSDDGKLLATRNRENVVIIYDTQSRRKLCEVSGHDNNWIETIDFSPDSKYFMTAAGSNEKVKIWNSQTGKLQTEIDTDAKAAYFSEDGTQVFVLGLTHVERYSWPGGRQVSRKQWRNNAAQAVAMSQDGRLVVVYRALTNQIFQTQVMDLENKSRIALDGPKTTPKCVVISPNNLWVAASYHTKARVHLWDLRDPHNSKYVLAAHKERVQSLAFSSDNRLLVSASWDRNVIAWDLLTRQSLYQFAGHTEHVNATACSPLDFTIASGATGKSDTSAIVWDLKERLLASGSGEMQSFGRIWNGLGASSVETSIVSTMQLVRQFEQMLPPLNERIQKDVSQATSADVDELVQFLNHPKFAVREEATKKLIMMRGRAEAELRRILNQTISAEVRYRVTTVLNQSVDRPTINFTDKRRWHRIVMALELINTVKSAELLQRIAAGHPNVDISLDAASALERNRIRSSF